jgi:hypothetical protein
VVATGAREQLEADPRAADALAGSATVVASHERSGSLRDAVDAHLELAGSPEDRVDAPRAFR